MLKELGQLAGMMRQLPKIRDEMERLQQRLGQLSAEGDAGGGMVRVKVNGRLEVVAGRSDNPSYSGIQQIARYRAQVSRTIDTLLAGSGARGRGRPGGGLASHHRKCPALPAVFQSDRR